MGIYINLPKVTTPWIYHNSGLKLISLSSDWSTWVTISDRNLWATSVYNYWDTLSNANCWALYQRGNDYVFYRTTAPSTSSSTTATSSYWPYYNCYISTFRTLAWDWSSTTNNDLWWDTTKSPIYVRQWPCDDWFHVPTQTEWINVVNIWTALWAWTTWEWWRINVMKYLKLPAWWSRAHNATFQYEWERWEYWTSSVNSSNAATAYFFRIYSTKVQTDWTAYKTYWYSIRPFKDEPTIPDDTWTVLYPTS